MKAGIGIISLLTGIAMMDSDKLFIPVALIIIGLVLVLTEKGVTDEPKINDYTRHDASYPSYLKR